MRTTLFGLCLFLFVYKATSVRIVDTDNELVGNQEGIYYLIPASNGLSGAIGVATVGNDSSPHTTVVLDTIGNGLPVRFASIWIDCIISTTMFLNIRLVTSAPELERWEVDEEFPIGRTVKLSKTAIMTMGRFRIEAVEDSYKFVYELGLVRTGGHYRLDAKNGDPFIFKIKKATDSNPRFKSIIVRQLPTEPTEEDQLAYQLVTKCQLGC
ncbi:hypothetical protein L6164_033219 [Bauhinia variegata]|uniref:Uncharacterized protein n=1 Tax=Bauhinia variegata TaxID=167791 RepID=A0ACB9KRF8_BAUVA|nr:hypothetical protein L6164_033219 [Bauhinia variegata]